jgi:hypothetical protein
MAMAATLHQSDFTATVGDALVTVNVTMERSFAVQLDFILHGRPYSFSMTKWSSRGGMAKFISLFYSSAGRDPAVFGSVVYDDSGEMVSGPKDDQKIQAVLQACKDIFRCLDQLLSANGSGLMDYAVWYREKHREEDTYSDYITKQVCHNIVHEELLAPATAWKLVKFAA